MALHTRPWQMPAPWSPSSGGGGAGSVLLAVPSPSRLSPARQHSFSSAGLSPHNALGAAKRCGGHKERPMQHGAYPQERHPSEEPLM